MTKGQPVVSDVRPAGITATRVERDFLGSSGLPADALWGIHTARALAHFHISGRLVHRQMAMAYGAVKLACLLTNIELGCSRDPAKTTAMEHACRELAEGALVSHIVTDALQGGAGTSTNMNVNEVLANRTLQLLGRDPGDYSQVSPLEDLNLHQSTNDTYPTALKLAAIRMLRELEKQVVRLQESFQSAEKRFARVVKVGRTQCQDAVLITLGREMGAYAEALGRDRWRIYKCEERLRVINLGGTAIGTGVVAPREYIFRVSESLRSVTGIGFARAENLVEATQNVDVFVEVSGILKALAATLWKVSGDLRLLSSGPEAGLGEIRLPARQAGSSIMPGKVNPVIPETVAQAAMKVFANDTAISLACAAGSLELNPFLPLVADALLETFDLLSNACFILALECVDGIEADETRCRAHVENSTATATALLPVVGYDGACEMLQQQRESGKSLREIVIARGVLSDSQFDRLISAEAVCRLGTKSEAAR